MKKYYNEKVEAVTEYSNSKVTQQKWKTSDFKRGLINKETTTSVKVEKLENGLQTKMENINVAVK